MIVVDGFDCLHVFFVVVVVFFTFYEGDIFVVEGKYIFWANFVGRRQIILFSCFFSQL